MNKIPTKKNITEWVGSRLMLFLIIFKIFKCSWYLLLCYREASLVRSTKEVPQELAEFMSLKRMKRAGKYHLRMISAYAAFVVYNTFIHIISLQLKLLSYEWAISGIFSTNEYIHTASFIILNTFTRALIILPFKYYSQFYIDHKFGVKRKSKDRFLAYMLQSTFGAALLNVMTSVGSAAIVNWGGDNFYIYFMVGTIVVEALLLTLYADHIAPALDNYSPLPSCDVKKKVEEVAKRVNFPLYKIQVLKTGKTHRGNAYFTGMFKGKRIILHDTILTGHYEKTFWRPRKTYTAEEIAGIVAHELGHWKLHHMFEKIAYNQVFFYFEMMLSAKIMQYPFLYSMFGFNDEKPAVIGLITTLHILFEPFDMLFRYLGRVISRSHELEADEFARCQGLGKQLSTALCKLFCKSLLFPVADPLFKDFYFTHPTVVERLQILKPKNATRVWKY